MRPRRDAAADGMGARQAAWLFVVAGVIGAANNLLPGTLGHGKPLSMALDLIKLAVGCVAFFVPWGRWRPRVALVLPVYALAHLTMSMANGLLPEAVYSVALMLVFVWVGQWQPPRTSFVMGALAAIAYIVPFGLGAPLTPGVRGAIALAIPCCPRR